MGRLRGERRQRQLRAGLRQSARIRARENATLLLSRLAARQQRYSPRRDRWLPARSRSLRPRRSTRPPLRAAVSANFRDFLYRRDQRRALASHSRSAQKFRHARTKPGLSGPAESRAPRPRAETSVALQSGAAWPGRATNRATAIRMSALRLPSQRRFPGALLKSPSRGGLPPSLREHRGLKANVRGLASR